MAAILFGFKAKPGSYVPADKISNSPFFGMGAFPTDSKITDI